MPNETFDLLRKNCQNAELSDSEKPSSSEEGDKTATSVEKPANAEWRKQNDGYYQTTWPTSNALPREKETALYMRRMLQVASLIWKSRKAKTCQRFLVRARHDSYGISQA